MASKLLITPYNGSTTAGQDPKIQFQGTGNSTDITLRVAADGSLSFEGSAGQLLSITNSLTGSIWSVNDVSGIPALELLDTGLVKVNEFYGNLQIGGTSNTANTVTFKGTTESSSLATGSAFFAGGVSITKNLTVGNSIGVASGTTGAGYFGLGTVLTSGAGANDTSIRWDGSSGSLNFSAGSSRVGYITSAGGLVMTGTITASSTISSTGLVTGGTGGAGGLGVWGTASMSYGINMSITSDGTYGGRIAGETTSDYNMYFNLIQGTNRGFVFRNSLATPLFAINGDKVRSNVGVDITGALTVTTTVKYGVSSAVSGAGTVQGGATVLTTSLNNVTTVAAGTGVILPTTAAGLRIVVRNGGANALKVYPTGTTTINAAGAGVAFSLDVGAMIEFIAMTATNWYTLNGTYL